MKKYSLLFLFCFSFSYSYSQCGDTMQVITVQNPSFEGPSQAHVVPSPWQACYGSPDTQPGQWGLTQAPSNGTSYISVLQSGTPGAYQEGTSQQLSSCLLAGNPYTFSIDLAFSAVYNTAEPMDCYGSLQIWGANSMCGKEETIWQSGVITNTNWQTYTISLTPTQNLCYISMAPYHITDCSGYINIMIDNMSPIVSLDNSHTVNITSPAQNSEQSCLFSINGNTDSIPQSIIISGNFSGSPVNATVSGLNWQENIFYPFDFNGTDTVYVTAVFPICSVTNSLIINVLNIAPYFIAEADSGYTVVFMDSTTSSSGNILSWLWNFGDGTTDTVQNPIHVYDTAGIYNVCLTVADSCGSDSFCSNVLVCALLSSAFSYTDSSFLVNFTNLSSGAISYLWNFGDGTMDSIPDPSHVYDSAGTYYVCLSVNNLCGNTSFCDSIVVNCLLPVSGFEFSDSLLAVFFSGISSGAINWKWNFGDGNTDSIQNPIHIYDSIGSYEVCLTVLNNCGNDTYCDSITLFCPLPTAEFTYSDSLLVVSFTNLSSNFISQNWDYGDGDLSTTQNPIHSYINEGTYWVCLIVFNSCGSDTFCDSVPVFSSGTFQNVIKSQIVIFPNPTTDKFSIEWTKESGNVTIVKIYNLLGEVAYSLSVPNGYTKQPLIEIDLSNFPPGIYFITLQTGNEMITRKLLLNK